MGVPVLTVLLAAMIGALAGPLLRGEIFAHSVPAGDAWRQTCPGCGASVVRAASWFAGPLPPSGRCPRCRVKLGPPIGTVELAAGAVAGLAAAAARYGPHPDRFATVAMILAALFGLILASVDAAVHRLPDRLTGSAFAVTATGLVLAAATAGDWRRLGVAGLGAGFLALGYLIMAVVPRVGMGLGDVKLAPLVGLVTGWFGLSTTVFGALAGLALAGLVALVLLLAGRVQRSTAIAHGPYMLAGGLVGMLLSVTGG
jgi:leader peptidase (prepilin peptidase)/N-methyltransferase